MRIMPTLMIAAALFGAAAAAAPEALADNDRNRGRHGYNDRGYRGPPPGWRHRGPPPRAYYPAPRYYAPPPVYYAPQPYYRPPPPPGIYFQF
ncbi:hypothetical protein ACQW02_02900 [Humitalea sp. 24SJ18S-53]|uniref:hypothetical protein n=1 Tax=Humitalea sp. 24SJ18S-53 TaxID=3422307 RepID=UPI003D67D0B0